MKKAFTVIEMLLVIAVLAILISVLVVTFSGVDEAGMGAKCLANMRSLAMACHSVGSETGGYPLAGSFSHYTLGRRDSASAAGGWIAWSSASSNGKYISPYSADREARKYSLENGQIWSALAGAKSTYVCPLHQLRCNDKILGSCPEGPLWSYVMNAYFGWGVSGQSQVSLNGVSYTGLVRSDRVLLFAELPFTDVKHKVGKAQMTIQTANLGAGASMDNDPILQYYGNYKSHSENIGFNHISGSKYVAHVCFADGHVEKLEMPRRAQENNNLRNLTVWLCKPNDNISQDIVLENGLYRLR